MEKDDGWKIIVVEILIALLGYVLLALFTNPIYLYGGTADPTTLAMTGGTTFSWATLWLMAWLAYTVASVVVGVINPVGPDEIGVRVLIGKPIGTVTSGPPVVPPGLAEIEIYPATTPQVELPAEPEKIFRAIEGQPDVVPEGMRPPLRVLFGESLAATDVLRVLGDPATGGYAWVWRPGKEPSLTVPYAEANKIHFDASVGDNGLAKGQTTAEVSHISRIRIHDAVALTKNVPRHEKTRSRLDEVFRQIEDEQVIVINTIYPKISVAQAQRNMEWMNAILFKAVERRVKAVGGHSEEWGIDLEGAAIKLISLNRDYNTAIANAGISAYALTVTINEAKGKEETLRREGAGNASAAHDLEMQRLVGRGEGLKQAAAQTGLTPEQLLGAEVAGQIGAGEGKIIFGLDGLTSIASGVIAALAPKKPKP